MATDKIDFSPIEEYNRAIAENRRELENNTRSLRSPFKKLITTIGETNQELAKIATDSIKGTQDTWKGLITEGRKEKAIRAAFNEEYKYISEEVNASQKRQKDIQTEYEEFQRDVSRQEQKRAREKEDMAFQEKILQEEIAQKEKEFYEKESEQSLKEYEEAQKFLEKMQEVNKERTAALDEEEETQNRRNTFQQRTFEDSIQSEKDYRREAEKTILEANEALEQKLEELSSTEKFDKFTGSIKTLTGGIIDIEGVLDPVAKQIGALKDLGASIGITGENMKKGFGKLKSVFKGTEDAGEESGKTLKERTEAFSESLNRQNKKTKMGFGKLLKNVGLTGLALLALVIVVKKLMDTFPRFGNWMRKIMGLDPIPEATKTEFDNLSDEDKAGDIGQDLIDQQEDRLEFQEDKEGIVGTDRAAENVQAAGAFVKATGTAIKGTDGGVIKKAIEGYKSGGAMYNSAGQLVDENMKYRAPITTGERVTNASKEALKQAPRSLVGNTMKVVSKAAAPATVLLTGFEIKRNLEESSDMRATLDELLASGQITQEDFDEYSGYIDEKEKEDVVKPITSTAAGVTASAVTAKVAAPMLAFGPPGWIAYAITVAAAGLTASAVADKVVDTTMTGDDKINEALDEYGESFDTDDIKDDLNEMYIDQENAAEKIKEMEIMKSSGIDTSAADVANIVQAVADNKTSNTSHHYESGGARESGVTAPGN